MNQSAPANRRPPPVLFDQISSGMVDVLGPLMDLPKPKRGDDGFAVIRTIFPSGAFVPLHSQADRTVIVVLEGELEAWFDGGWRTFGQGTMFDSRAGLRHALRNRCDTPAAVVLATTQRMRQFLVEIGRHTTSEDRDSVLIRFGERSEAYGYWVGTREQQEAIGLTLGAFAPIPPPAPTEIHVPGKHGGHDIPIDRIIWIEAARDYLLVHTLSGASMMRGTMANFERRFGETFIRAHRSALVAPRHVSGWITLSTGRYGLLMADESRISVSARRLAAMRQKLRRIRQ